MEYMDYGTGNECETCSIPSKLVLDARKATLYNTSTGFEADLGPFVAINADELKDYDDWSFDISTDTYYVVKPMISKKI